MTGLPIRICGLLLIAVPFCFGQAEPTKRPPRADETQIPLPIGSPVFKPGMPALTAKQKSTLAFQNTFYPRSLASRLLLTAWDEVRNDPAEWPGGAEGFGMRFGNRMASLAVRQGIQLAADVAFHTEPRYDPCGCSSAKGRFGHSWRRVFLSRTDAGGEMVSVARLGSAFAAPWITHTWLPDSDNTTSRKLQSAGTNLALRGLSNMIRDFWPDIARKTHMPKRFGGN